MIRYDFSINFNRMKDGSSFIRKGFTLIELLVVISIIGLLSSVVLASLNSARASARDVQRDSDMYVIKQALERYWLDNNQYPNSGSCGATIPNGSWCNSVQSLSNGRWIAGGALSPYLPSDPVDPTDNGTANWMPTNGNTYFYYSSSSNLNGSTGGQYYILKRGYENKTEPTDFRFCNGSTYAALATGKSNCN